MQHLEHKPQMLALLVKNHGKGMAEQVRFKAEVLPDDEDARTIAAELAKMDMFALGTDAVASGETYGRVFADISSCRRLWKGARSKGY
ncbi:putative inner membrane protein [Neisseria gonorrhoeae]|uniref:Putative inner membrane protein n=1 Tax=Neisseria gonorrhoeae TaxID=485 RepID=A0A379B0W5_NEIGO|nr:putative inner membrane protein [Neisseria gonorrhoeae]